MTTVKFYQRNLSIATPAASKAQFTVVRYSKDAVGGCYEATIEARGSQEELAELLNWARYPAEIYNAAGERVWWGYVREIRGRFGKTEVKVDINKMGNRVAVAYTQTALGEASRGERKTTPWAEDAKSIREFGRRDRLEGEGGISEVAALAKRDRILKRWKYPHGEQKIDLLSAKANAPAVMTLVCEGWWHTLDWMYASVPTQLVAAFESLGTLEQTVGCDYVDDGLNVRRLAQTIMTGPSTWNVLQVGLYLRRVGLPLDNLSVSICELEENGEPGTAVASGTITAGSVGTEYGWLICTLTDSVVLAAARRYALQVSFSGTPDAANYYVFKLDQQQGYAGGVFRQYVSSWSLVNADMPFRLRTDALVASDAQIHSLISAYGQFLGRVYVQTATGLNLESYRPGDADALTEIEGLMEIGTAGGARLLAEVDAERNARVFAMPDESSAVMYLRPDGKFYHHNVAPLDPSTCPVGFWALPAAVLPANVDTTRISGLGVFFVETSEYDVGRGQLYYTELDADEQFRIRPEAG